ncbi:MAG: aspartate/glutamate racemase family protein, partial [Sphingomonadales bacterium]|nr:aspartate/glutamate racemase family protein [Sphingomonadales bacterium]
CNTASVIALDPVRAALHLPIVGTVPAIKPAAEISKTRVIGVLGTESTVRQPYVDNLNRDFASDCTVIRHGSARLVELAEHHVAGDTPPVEEFASILDKLFSQPRGGEIDTIVLACTHFPLVEEQLAAAAPHPVSFVHGGDGIARRIAHLTERQPWPDAAPPPAMLVIGAGPGDEALFEGMRGYGFEGFEFL